MSMRSLLVWGLLAGLLGGVLAFGFASVYGEPPVDAAIAIEEQGGGHDHGTTEDDAPVSRDVQSTLGLAVATCAFGTALGGLVALVFAFANGRLRTRSPRATVGAVIAIGFVAVVLVPYVIYPPNPPAVGHADTIGDRAAAYFGIMAISVVLAIAAVYVGRTGALAAVGAALGYVVAVAVAGALLPDFDEVPHDFPAQTLWDFRLASLGTQVVLWAAVGVAFAALLARATNRATAVGTAAG
ncbi:CbtA family protein [Actinophytocola sp.]|uniref:CbtA family protein n=1 Tax=Actinophytocola sp. TaxID=1872138 RepID=UPI00389A80DE